MTAFPYRKLLDAGCSAETTIAQALAADGWDVIAQKPVASTTGPNGAAKALLVQRQPWELVKDIVKHYENVRALSAPKEEN